MLAHRIIPTVLVSGDKLVKGKQFNAWRSVGHAQQAARIYAQRQVDEIILLDIAARGQNRGPDLNMVSVWTQANFSPVTVGGGVRRRGDVEDLLDAGADKVAICTAFAEHPSFVQECAGYFGSQAIVVVIDVGPGNAVMVNCGKVPHSYDPLYYARAAERAGAGEILLTAIPREGMLDGYDLELIRDIAKAVSIPVIAHGGAGTYEHMRQAIEAGADAVAAGAMFQFTDQTPQGAARYLASCGIEVRLPEEAKKCS